MSNGKSRVQTPPIINDEIAAIIVEAVNKGIEAGLKKAKQEEQARFNAYQAAEVRLYALPDLKDKVHKDQEHINDLEEHPELPGKSKDICRFQASGIRLSDSEIIETLIQDLKAKVAKNQYEIDEVSAALEPMKADQYYPALVGKYFSQVADKVVAAELKCDETTVWRNRTRLVRRVAVRLYGVDAIK